MVIMPCYQKVTGLNVPVHNIMCTMKELQSTENMHPPFNHTRICQGSVLRHLFRLRSGFHERVRKDADGARVPDGRCASLRRRPREVHTQRRAPDLLTPPCAGVEEIEFVTPVDIWRRAGFEVPVAALRCGVPPALGPVRFA